MVCTTTLGSFGSIRPLLINLLRTSNINGDVELVCGSGASGGVIRAHRFILGAQSNFLKEIILNTGAHDEVTRIFLPDVECKHMGIVVKFLYTGKMKLQESQVEVVKELLENILYIDAKITLPKIEAKEEDKGRGDPGGGGGDDSEGGANSDDSRKGEGGQPPPKKRFRPTQEKTNGQSPSLNGSFDKLASSAAAPPSPPHSLAGDDMPMDQEEEIDIDEHGWELENQANVKNEFNQDIPKLKKEDSKQQMDCQYCSKMFSDEETLEEHLRGHLELLREKENIPEAPRIVSKRPGGPVVEDALRKKEDLVKKEESNVQSKAKVDDPKPSTSKEAFPANENTGTPEEPTEPQPQTSWMDDDDYFPVLDLPPPIPLPPENGLTLYRGEWLRKEVVDKYRAKREANRNHGSIRPYNYQPFVTITGKSKSSTVDAREVEEKGDFMCPYEGCFARYEYKRSLEVHMKRSHNQNLRVQCPECDKWLSSKTAIPKHLLSHRPREYWPIQCPFPHCARRFQAKGDLPKHFMTSAHRNQVPEIGSPEWKALIEKGVLIPNYKDLLGMQPIGGRPGDGIQAEIEIDRDVDDPGEEEDVTIEPDQYNSPSTNDAVQSPDIQEYDDIQVVSGSESDGRKSTNKTDCDSDIEVIDDTANKDELKSPTDEKEPDNIQSNDDHDSVDRKEPVHKHRIIDSSNNETDGSGVVAPLIIRPTDASSAAQALSSVDVKEHFGQSSEPPEATARYLSSFKQE